MWITCTRTLISRNSREAGSTTRDGLGEGIRYGLLFLLIHRHRIEKKIARPTRLCVSPSLPRWTSPARPRCHLARAALSAHVRPSRAHLRIDIYLIFRVVLHETMVGFVLPLCSHLPHASEPTPVSQVTTLIDLQSVSFSAMWSLRGHLQQASTLATANYPETLSTIAVVNSPSFFPTIWGWIKGWFDEGTRNKIHVLGKDPGPTLRSLIDSKDLPKAYGGELQWEYGDEPSLDEAATQAIGKVPRGPAFFADGAVVEPQKGAKTAETETSPA